MKTEIVKLSQIQVNEANPRTITKEKFSKLVTSILVLPKMLELRPIVVDNTFTALGGNMRLRALNDISTMTDDEVAQALNASRDFQKKTEAEKTLLIEYWARWRDTPTAPVIKASELSDAEQREFIIKDNVGFGEWDMDALANEWDAEELNDWGIEDYLHAEDFEKEAEEDDYSDEDTENAPTRCNPGDIWILGNHRLMCGDSTKESDVAKLMNNEKADLLLTDPPYNVDYQGGTKDKMKIANDNMDDVEFVGFLTAAFNCAIQSMRPGAAFYVWHADCKGFEFRKALKDVGLTLRETLIWVKNALVLGRQDYQWRHEPCLYGWKDGEAHYFIDDRSQSTVIFEDKPTRNDIHPTMKPVKLMARLINNSSKSEQLVLDLFGGSGSTLIACEQVGRKCYTMEFDPKYCDAILDRWEKLTSMKAVRITT